MILKEFLENPMGRGESSTNRALLKEVMDSKYNKLVKDKGHLFKTNVFHELTTDNYFVHIVIPTETYRDNSYDVVLYFYTTETKQGLSLATTHDMKFFSNSPSFAYTFAKVYYDEGLLIEQLANKYPDEILKNKPEVRNRYGIVNYDKYLYFGCKYVLESRILDRATIGLRSINYTPIMLNQKVRTLDRIMIEYRKAEAKLKQKKIDKASEVIQKAIDKRARNPVHNVAKHVPIKKITGKAKKKKKS